MSHVTFDAAVLGLGSMGAFTCLELARRKASVIGFDRFAPPHDRGSHSGDTRVYREAYAEHPNYVPLAKRAGLRWDEFAQQAGRMLLHRAGMLSIGAESSALIGGIRDSARLHSLAVERLTAEEIRRRYPALHPPEDAIGLFEPAAGWIDVNGAIEFALDQARREGADVRLNAAVEGYERDGPQFKIRTPDGVFRAARLIVTAGAWSAATLRDLSLPLRVLRKVLVWVDPIHPHLFTSESFPIFAFAERFFYGFPNLHGRGVKIGIHVDPEAPLTAAHVRQPEVTSAELEPVLAQAAQYIPMLSGPLPGAHRRVLGAGACLYTMTPDEHFILDRHPASENLWVAAGFSGHGFKFAPAIAEALTDLALNGRAALPVEFLRCAGRFE